MINRVYIIPVEGGLLRDTDGTIVPATGKEVLLNTYWSRRLKKGDCVKREETPDLFSPDAEDSDKRKTGMKKSTTKKS